MDSSSELSVSQLIRNYYWTHPPKFTLVSGPRGSKGTKRHKELTEKYMSLVLSTERKYAKRDQIIFIDS